MKEIIHTDEKGRKYKVLIDSSMGDELSIIIGPPVDLVDELDLPEPFATRLHNNLCDRGIFTFKDLSVNNRAVQGALQEALSIDVQRLAEAYSNYEKETV